ncbi:WHG domain-containing protein [Phycicoccus sp. M110.8]|uniref:TetR/AcrR family transcriptional regulator n=1 Tax=Phycicoccus sp. M110.8 TaxID=3075433 RepID=UPI0028FD6E06|nr:WHG domain-containing protein [Phycicoccus sp. M110.8]MDU0313695.1 WHG domain-containing protein [Phycicoccus sp. M110.8]
MPTGGGVRARHRAAVEADIVEIGRRHLARDGAAALSLRAIARDLGMVSSALYRYVANRDDLLTLLIVASYTSLADEVERAHDAVDADDLAGRWRAIAGAMRHWALARPHEYALLYGSPVPDYAAPAERTTEPGTRVLALVLHLLDDAVRSGRLATTRADLSTAAGARASAERMLTDSFFAGSSIDAQALLAAMAAWSMVMGTLSAEVFEQLGPQTVADPQSWFDHMVGVAGRLVLADD